MSQIESWLTCTPVCFRGDQSFFSRDSGLLCKGFQTIGVPCRAIMPGPEMPDDCREELTRTPYRNLESADWWKASGAQGVVLYAWGAPRYYPIARAIRHAGLKLVCNMDTSGTFGVLGGPLDYWGAQWRILNGIGTTPSSLCMFFLKFISSISWSLLKNDTGRARHLRQADLIGAVSPIAVQRIRRVCRWYGGTRLAARVQLIPHAVSLHMKYDGHPKKPRVVSIGRWQPEDWRQKNPRLLLETATQVLSREPKAEFVVVGSMDPSLRGRFSDLAERTQGRLRVAGRLPNQEIAGLLQTAQISFCSSNHESFHIASAEALCCGCSVVGPDLPELPSLHWFVRAESGQLSAKNPDSLSTTVLNELELWGRGARCASQISNHWIQHFHADRVAQKILDYLVRANETSRISRKPEPDQEL